MSNSINQPNLNVPLPSSTTSSDSSISTSVSVADLGGPSGPSAVYGAKSTASNANVQDAYGVAAPGVRGNVLSTTPPVPSDTEAVGATSLRSAQGKVSYLSEGSSVGSQALSLAAENPTASVTVSSKAISTPGALGSGSATSSPSSSSTTSSTSTSDSNTMGLLNESPSTAADSADATAATEQSKKWTDSVGKKCKHADNDMAKATGLPKDVAKQAYNLMKNSNTSDYNTQIGTAMAVLAQEKKEGSSSYTADKATITSALQTLTDNADTRQKGSGTTKAVAAFDGALSSLSKVVTAHLGSDPSGGAPKTDAFDTSSAKVVNSWA